MHLSKKLAVISKECVACGCCKNLCAMNAISVFKGLYAQVDVSKCIGCGICQKACPASVISIVERRKYSDKKKELV